MKYRFPLLQTIDDVLPHIKGYDEFIVADKGDYTVINYVVATSDTFTMTGDDDISGSIRRECRGLIFDRKGILISRPFHKFFNVNEREETQIFNLNLNEDHVLMEKMDGSMVRPLALDGKHVRLGTKMGLTDIADMATALLTEEQHSWLLDQYLMKRTPLLEYTAPENRIVIAYPEPKLVLLGVRDNHTGTYTLANSPFDIVPVYGSLGNKSLSEYIETAREQQDREGDIIRFHNGHMLKIKNDWYVRIHKMKDKISSDKNILELILNEELDDVFAHLTFNDRDYVKNFETSFWNAFKAKEEELRGLYESAVAQHGKDKKGIATQFVPNLKNKEDAQFIFGQFDAKDLRAMLLNHVAKHISSNVKFDALSKWMNLEQNTPEMFMTGDFKL